MTLLGGSTRQRQVESGSKTLARRVTQGEIAPPRAAVARAIPWALGAAVLLVQLAVDVVLHHQVNPLYSDAGAYSSMAARLAQHWTFGPQVAFRPPGWILVLAGLYRVFGVHPNVGLVFNAILVAVNANLVLRLALRLGLPSPAAVVSAVGAGLFPWMLILGATLYSETFYVSIVLGLTLAVLALTGDTRPGRGLWWRWGLVGLVTASGILVRPALMFWVPIGLWFAFRRSGPRGWRIAASFLVGILLVLGVWTVRNYERLHAFVLVDTAGGSTLAISNNSLVHGGQDPAAVPILTGPEAQVNDEYQSMADHWITSHPGEFAVLVVERVVRSFDPMSLLNKGVVGGPLVRWAARILWMGVPLLAVVGVFRRHRESGWCR